MFARNLKSLLLAVAVVATAHSAVATLTQQPLLNRPNVVSPNLSLVFDTSGSMGNPYIFQYGYVDPGGNGLYGPGDGTATGLTPSNAYGFLSPDVNRLYYDPRVLYSPRIDYQGNNLATNAPTTKATGWSVYFRNTSIVGNSSCPQTAAYVTGNLMSLTCYYNPSYTPPASEVVAGSIATYPNVVNNASSALLTFPKFKNRTDCVTSSISCSLTEEGQNYSNWNKWYKTRILMATTSMGQAFQPLANDALRLSYGTIGNINSNNALNCGTASFTSSNAVPITCYAGQTASGSKDLFYKWLYAQTAGGGTPNKFAVDKVGQYFQRTDSDGPWSTLPNPQSTGFSNVTASGSGAAELPANHASCRRSFTILMTDGYTNGGGPTYTGGTPSGNIDSQVISIPSDGNGSQAFRQPATGSVAKPPFTDVYANTMADIAMKYWGTDLRPDLNNRVPPIVTSTVNNPSTWQNVSFYAITLGLDGTLPHTTTTLANLNSGATTWPNPVDNTPATVDDLWHATINARGEFLNAASSSQLTTGLGHLFASIAGTPQTLSGVAVSTTFLQNGTKKYKPEYVPGTWTGKLSAVALDPITGNERNPAVVYWQVESGVDPITLDPISTIPALATRQNQVFTWSGSAGVAFNTVSSGLSLNMVNYILGDPTNELRNAGGIYRSRTAKLGDIINASPAYILDNTDMNYELLSGSYGNYRSFVTSMNSRAQGVLFAGANDGMLHAFRDSDGVETFAYIPKAIIPNLSNLSVTPYTHQYFVDGPNAETHAYLSSNWTDILLGTVGAGGQAVYALDVTAPTAMNASKVLWEVNSSTPGFSNLGSIFTDIQAGPVTATGSLPNDEWVAIFGNGFASSTGVASLYVVNLKTGALLKEIVVDSSGNGLGGVTVVRDSTQRIIGAYAGDLKGNLWKFDLTGNSKANWKIDLGGTALYLGSTTQPVTSTPAVVPHPNGGYVVDFGTGKFFDTTDATAPYVTQRMYGVWDKQAFGTAAPPTGAAGVTGTTQLQQRTITSQLVGSTTYYSVDTNTLTWSLDGVTGIRGWYMNLPNSGERVPYPVQRLAAAQGVTIVLVSTLSPVSAAAADVCVQTGSGSGWNYFIDGLTGSGPTYTVLDTNHDGIIDSSDTVVSGMQDTVDGRPTPITKSINPTTGETTLVIETSLASGTQVRVCPPGGCGTGGGPGGGAYTVKKREWRQLFMR